MRNKYKISLLVIAILLAFSMTVGTSYAYWTTTVAQTGTNQVTAGCLKIELNDLIVDEDGNSVSSSINLPNSYPMIDTIGLTTKPYSLTIKNVCSIKANYTVLLNTFDESTLTEEYIKYHFVKVSPSETTMTPAVLSTLTPVTLDSSIASDIGVKNGGTVKNSYILSSGTLNAQSENVTDSVTYNLRLWIDYDAGVEIMDKIFESSVAVYAEATN